MKLLHVDSSILGDNSVSRQISAAVAETLKSHIPALEVTYRDLGAEPIGHLTGAYLAGQSADVKHDQALQEDLDLGGRALAEFLAWVRSKPDDFHAPTRRTRDRRGPRARSDRA